MESLKDFLSPTTFSFYGYIVAVGCGIGGTIFSASVGILRASERRNFHCNVGSKTPFDKNFLRASCFDQYDQQYNLPLPLYGFVLLSFFIQTFISIVYSWCCVKSRVEEVEQASKIDAENPRPRPTITTRRVFKCYLTQLLGRLILGILFTVSQNFVLYPSGFPTSFVCEKTVEKSKVPETNMTFFIDCKNSMGSDKDVWAMIVWIVNVILACLVAGEMIYLIIKAYRNKAFINDSEFCLRHLFNRRKTSRRVEEYRMSQRRRIIEGTQELDPLNPPSPGENEGCKNLDDVYVNLIIHTGRWKPEFDMKMDKLGILEQYVKSPENSVRIDKLEELFQPNKDSSNPRKILVLGCPGIGKTLLCTKLLQELSKGEIAQEKVRKSVCCCCSTSVAARKFLHLFLFHFRNFNSEEMKSMSLQTLLSHGKYSQGKLDVEIFQFVLEHPDKTLLVFDGLDEFKDHKNCLEEEEKHAGNGVTDIMSFAALYVKLVKGEILKGATVLTTTRPYAIDSVSSVGLKFDRTVEILGFSTEKVKEYCTKFFRDDQSALGRIWQHVQSNLNLLYLCYIPVNCFIVCSLLEKMIKPTTSSLEGDTLPTTLTEIYERALRLFIFKHHDPEYQGKTLKRSDLTSDKTFPTSVEETLLRLEALALKGIEERRLVFELEEVQGMKNCGLLNRMPDVENAPFTFKPQFCFIHLTMQEFVAARGIAKKNPKDLKKFISSRAEDEKWHLVIQFVAGLLRGKEAVVNEIFVMNLQDSLLHERTCGRDVDLLKMKCLYEANNITSVQRVAAELKANRKFTNCIDLSLLNLTPVDCTAIVCFLKHIDNLEYLDISENRSLGDGGCSELSKLIKAGGPKMLHLHGCGISDQGLITVLEAMKTGETCNLSELNVSDNEEITDKGFSSLCDTLMDKKCKLTGLVINDIFQHEHVSLKLSEALKHEYCKLTKLHLVGNSFDYERGHNNLCSSLIDENCKLSDLKLDYRHGRVPHGLMSHVCNALKHKNCKLTKLVIMQDEISDEDILCVCKALKHVNCNFTEFLVDILGISSDASENAIVICVQNFRSQLKISDLAMSYLCDTLKHKDCKLTRLYLAGEIFTSIITKKGIEDLQNAITHDNCKLNKLVLNTTWCGSSFLGTKCDAYSILNLNGHKVLARKRDSGQYEEIALSCIVSQIPAIWICNFALFSNQEFFKKYDFEFPRISIKKFK